MGKGQTALAAQAEPAGQSPDFWDRLRIIPFHSGAVLPLEITADKLRLDIREAMYEAASAEAELRTILCTHAVAASEAMDRLNVLPQRRAASRYCDALDRLATLSDRAARQGVQP